MRLFLWNLSNFITLETQAYKLGEACVFLF